VNTPPRILTLACLATVAAFTFGGPAAANASGSANAASGAAPCRDADVVPNKGNAARVRAATLCLVNVERRSRSLTRLRSSVALGKAAILLSRTMVRKRFFGHTSPGGSTMLSRIKRTSYINRSVRHGALGENLGWGCGSLATPQSMVDMWMHSASQRATILNRRFHHAGVGVAIGAPEKFDGKDAATYTIDFASHIRT